MKYEKSTFQKIALVISDALSISISFALAYYFRINFDSRPFYFEANTMSFALLAITLLPLWTGVNFITGLYDRAIFLYRPREYGRILLA